MTRRIFISYARGDVDIVSALRDDLSDAGFDVFIDLELAGGHVWWDSLLERIRDCDVFMPAVSTRWLESAACKLETDYALDVERIVFPVFIGDGASKLLPASIRLNQGLPYSTTEKHEILHLIADLNMLPASKPPPEPLPASPPAPISYLTALRDKVAVQAETTRSEQELLLAEFRRRLSKGDDRAELEILLRRFRRRDDLNVFVAEGIDDLLGAPNRNGDRRSTEQRDAAGGRERVRSDEQRASSHDQAVSEPPQPRVDTAIPPGVPGKTELVWSYVLAAISVLFVPILFGPAAIFLAHRAKKAGNPNGKQALGIAVAAMVVGFVLGFLVLTA